jgi:hypothetical protein
LPFSWPFFDARVERRATSSDPGAEIGIKVIYFNIKIMTTHSGGRANDRSTRERRPRLKPQQNLPPSHIAISEVPRVDQAEVGPGEMRIRVWHQGAEGGRHTMAGIVCGPFNLDGQHRIAGGAGRRQRTDTGTTNKFFGLAQAMRRVELRAIGFRAGPGSGRPDPSLHRGCGTNLLSASSWNPTC